MTEDDAHALVKNNVPRETMTTLASLAALVIEENARQNLIAPSTVCAMWSRHILDSAQLVWLAEGRNGLWLDIGAGAGFPGLVVALLRQQPVILVEPRAKRALFLTEAAAALGIASQVSVIAARVETIVMHEPAAVISARAVAALPALFQMGATVSNADTLWMLPKGRSAREEVANAQREWQGDIRLAPSLSDPESAIVVARDVRRRNGA